jgi:hypothetical protein
MKISPRLIKYGGLVRSEKIIHPIEPPIVSSNPNRLPALEDIEINNVSIRRLQIANSSQFLSDLKA